ncbi:hypothetical protein E1A91_D03G112400v1 [Gossypium mustelinum]|uniref:Dof zinc finger protein n=1 Tax=Gossypium mustelinum TaxID=34275 RepID=A0A5D2VLF6_GOSMU|nr:hypothetical protein E1A91_D03G112400v1 [Gossypium mustelinum]
MQDIHLIGGGRVFSSGGGGGGGDRRLRLQHQQQNNQALKCPRCDSLNTKFCYYNNYNLSQPRHFCKSCRRYWTKGGVRRNVPVGGGCRKAKRSKTKPSSESTTVAAAAPAQPQSQQLLDQRKANSHSSSDSSSLIAANSNVAVANKNNNDSSTGGMAEAVSAVTSHSNNINVSESKLYGNPNNLVFEAGLLEQGSESGIFPEIGSFTSLVTSSNNETSSLGFGAVLNGQGQWQQQKMMSVGGEEITGELLDQTMQVELSNLHGRSESGFGPLDWQGCGDQPFFDLPNDVDQSYWSQSQWSDQDHTALYLPILLMVYLNSINVEKNIDFRF